MLAELSWARTFCGTTHPLRLSNKSMPTWSLYFKGLVRQFDLDLFNDNQFYELAPASIKPHGQHMDELDVIEISAECHIFKVLISSKSHVRRGRKRKCSSQNGSLSNLLFHRHFLNRFLNISLVFGVSSRTAPSPARPLMFLGMNAVGSPTSCK